MTCFLPRRTPRDTCKKGYFQSSCLIGVCCAVLVLLGMPGSPSQTTGSRTNGAAPFTIVPLPNGGSLKKYGCRVGKTVRELGRLVKFTKKVAFQRLTSRQIHSLIRTKTGKKLVKACADQKPLSVRPIVVLIPGPEETRFPVVPQPNECADGIDNDGDGLTDADDPDCWISGSQSEKALVVTNKTWALAWDDSFPEPDNFVAPVRLATWKLDNIDYYRVELAKQPAGQRTLLLQYSDLFEIMANEPQDYCRGANNLPDFSCLFWDKGSAKLGNILDTFFSRLKASGADLDYLTLDFEGGLGNWNLNLWDEASYTRFFGAVLKDPRWSGPRSDLIKVGFPDVSMPFNILDPAWNHLSYQQWNAIFSKYVVAYLNNAIFSPVRKYFPHVAGSNWGSRQCDPRYQLPEYNGHIECQFPIQETVGGEQNVVLYGGLGNIRWLKWRDINGYPATYFNALRFDLNWVKSAKLSGPAPVSGWIAYKEFQSSYNSKDSMSEVVLQGLAGGVQRLLVWNPHASNQQNPTDGASFSSDMETSQAIKEFDMLTGKFNFRYDVSQMENWNSAIISSCLILENAGRICRVSTDPACSYQTVESTAGTLIKACGQERFIEGVRVWRGTSVGPLGIWLVPQQDAQNF